LTADINLKALLAVHPTASLTVGGLGEPRLFTEDDLETALREVPHARPDLLALQAGYRSQEEAVWIAVLSQFPTITLGFTRAADTSNVHTIGLAATVNLPIFNGARGEIRIQSATRAQLQAEYQARLDQTTADAWRLWQEMQLLQAQIGELKAKLPAFRRMADNSRRAYANRDLAPATYILLQTSLTAREGEVFDLEASLWIDSIALHTILGQPYVTPPRAAKP
jgi:outer membrane protein TolC